MTGLLVLLVLGVIGAFALAGWLGLALFVSTDKAQKKAEANAPALLDELFNGDDDVTYTTNWSSMKYETVVLGGRKRGYRLIHETSNSTKSAEHKTLMFERAA